VDPERNCLIFTKEAEGMEIQAMASLAGESFRLPPAAMAASVQPDVVKTIAAKPAKK
jgi:hypothetical protein